MEDPGTSGNWEEMFAGHLREKQAGPLTCPICAQTNSFKPKGTIGGYMADNVARPEFQFGYAACGNCGYSIFFDASVTGLWFEHLGGEQTSLVTEGDKPTGITYEDAIEAAEHRGSIDFEGRKARVVGFNTKSSIDERNSARIMLDLGDEYLVLVGYFWGGELMEESRERHPKQ
jgi:predicted nucleic-acid-binding Zn-ribbon protein